MDQFALVDAMRRSRAAGMNPRGSPVGGHYDSVGYRLGERARIRNRAADGSTA
jgi:hypothetical protein